MILPSSASVPEALVGPEAGVADLRHGRLGPRPVGRRRHPRHRRVLRVLLFPLLILVPTARHRCVAQGRVAVDQQRRVGSSDAAAQSGGQRGPQRHRLLVRGRRRRGSEKGRRRGRGQHLIRTKGKGGFERCTFEGFQYFQSAYLVRGHVGRVPQLEAVAGAHEDAVLRLRRRGHAVLLLLLLNAVVVGAESNRSSILSLSSQGSSSKVDLDCERWEVVAAM